MSYTVLDLAKISLAVYAHPLPKVEGWQTVRNFGTHEKHGFYAGLYQQRDLFVLGYRGTDDWQVDLVDDATILLAGFRARCPKHEPHCPRHKIG
jgi:hypothetical protein